MQKVRNCRGQKERQKCTEGVASVDLIELVVDNEDESGNGGWVQTGEGCGKRRGNMGPANLGMFRGMRLRCCIDISETSDTEVRD